MSINTSPTNLIHSRYDNLSYRGLTTVVRRVAFHILILRQYGSFWEWEREQDAPPTCCQRWTGGKAVSFSIQLPVPVRRVSISYTWWLHPAGGQLELDIVRRGLWWLTDGELTADISQCSIECEVFLRYFYNIVLELLDWNFSAWRRREPP